MARPGNTQSNISRRTSAREAPRARPKLKRTLNTIAQQEHNKATNRRPRAVTVSGKKAESATEMFDRIIRKGK